MTDVLKGLVRALVVAGLLFLVLTLAASLLSALAIAIPVLFVLAWLFRPRGPRMPGPEVRRRVIIIDHRG
ncbi:hypothetical protein [Zavarzinia sp.]|uniref:hypothetical protein n=1 Tax=Zavarzinia sp. TaxID=2027920 RepID=UPI00356B0FB5